MENTRAKTCYAVHISNFHEAHFSFICSHSSMTARAQYGSGCSQRANDSISISHQRRSSSFNGNKVSLCMSACISVFVSVLLSARSCYSDRCRRPAKNTSFPKKQSMVNFCARFVVASKFPFRTKCWRALRTVDLERLTEPPAPRINFNNPRRHMFCVCTNGNCRRKRT